MKGDNNVIDSMEVEPESTGVDDNIVIPWSDQHECRIVIARLRNNKAAGADSLLAELFKHGGE